MYNAETQRFEAVRSTKTPEAIAKDAVAAILEEGEPITIMDVAAGAPKGKHLRHRMIDIPEHLISDFIIKDPRVLHSYAQRVGKRMEFIRNFGNRSIEEVLDEMEVDMRAAGYSEKKIQGLRQDFLLITKERWVSMSKAQIVLMLRLVRLSKRLLECHIWMQQRLHRLLMLATSLWSAVPAICSLLIVLSLIRLLCKGKGCCSLLW